MTDLTYAIVTGKSYAEQLCARIDQLKKENDELRNAKTILEAKLTLATAAPLRDLPPIDDVQVLQDSVERLRADAKARGVA